MKGKFLAPIFLAGLISTACFAQNVAVFDLLKIDTYQKNCAQNATYMANDCYFAGIANVMQFNDEGSAKAYEYFKKAHKLDAKNVAYTSMLARFEYDMFKQSNVSVHLKDAMKLFNQACDEDDANSCNKLASIYEFGESDIIAVDIGKAAKYYKKSCELKNIDGCYKLGTFRGE